MKESEMSFLEIASRPRTEVPKTQFVVNKPVSTVHKQKMCQTQDCKKKVLPEEDFCFDCISYSKNNRRCANFDICGKLRFKENTLCFGCQRDLGRRCANFDFCGNLTRYDHWNKKQFEICSNCFRSQMEFEKLCPNNGACGGYRRFNHATGYRYDYCPDCA